MAGVTHSAFRRLVADFGGYGACYGNAFGQGGASRKVGETPFTKRRPEEGFVWYQLALNGSENIAAIIDRLKTVRPRPWTLMRAALRRDGAHRHRRRAV